MNKYNIEPDKSLVGTGYHKSYVNATVADMKKLLGKPTHETNTGEEDINYEWIRSVDVDGKKIPFSVYDWREGKKLDDNDLVKWRINGKNIVQTDIVEELIDGDLKEI